MLVFIYFMMLSGVEIRGVINLSNVEGVVNDVTVSCDELTLEMESSGGTREVRNVKELPGWVAKIMPATRSQYWQQGWDQNEVEFRMLEKLQNCPVC